MTPSTIPPRRACRLSSAAPPRLAALLALTALSLSCATWRAPAVPLRTIELAPRSGGSCLAVLLPGRWDEPERFRRAGFAAAVAQRGLQLDLVAVDAHLGYYRDRSVVERLRADVVAPARAAGYREIWLVGISLGGLGGLTYLREHPEDLAGVLALAPYLGEAELVREIEAAGGAASWRPQRSGDGASPGRELWSWLAPWAAESGGPPLHLAWGEQDELARASRLLAALLPGERLYAQAGGHDWKTWQRLWEQFLDRTVLCRARP